MYYFIFRFRILRAISTPALTAIPAIQTGVAAISPVLAPAFPAAVSVFPFSPPFADPLDVESFFPAVEESPLSAVEELSLSVVEELS